MSAVRSVYFYLRYHRSCATRPVKWVLDRRKTGLALPRRRSLACKINLNPRSILLSLFADRRLGDAKPRLSLNFFVARDFNFVRCTAVLFHGDLLASIGFVKADRRFQIPT